MMLQDISENSVMWRMYAGWNERRAVNNSPIFAYTDGGFIQVDNLSSAVIHPGSNMQSASFWNALVDFGTGQPPGFVNSPIAGDTYDGQSALSDVQFVNPLFGSDRPPRRRLTTPNDSFMFGPVQQGDIIGPWIIEDLTALYDLCRWKEVSYGTSALESKLGGGALDNCAASIASARSTWGGNSVVQNVTYRSLLRIDASVGRPSPFTWNHNALTAGFLEPAILSFSPVRADRGELLIYVRRSDGPLPGAGPYAQDQKGYLLQALSSEALESGHVTMDIHALAGITHTQDPWTFHGLQCDEGDYVYLYEPRAYIRYNFTDLAN